MLGEKKWFEGSSFWLVPEEVSSSSIVVKDGVHILNVIIPIFLIIKISIFIPDGRQIESLNAKLWPLFSHFQKVGKGEIPRTLYLLISNDCFIARSVDAFIVTTSPIFTPILEEKKGDNNHSHSSLESTLKRFKKYFMHFVCHYFCTKRARERLI